MSHCDSSHFFISWMTRRINKTNRRRSNVVTVAGGKILLCTAGPTAGGRAPASQTLYRPRRDGLINIEMADLTRVQPRFRSQEVPFTNARNSGIFWYSTSESSVSFQVLRRRLCMERAWICLCAENINIRWRQSGGNISSPVVWSQTAKFWLSSGISRACGLE